MIPYMDLMELKPDSLHEPARQALFRGLIQHTKQLFCIFYNYKTRASRPPHFPLLTNFSQDLQPDVTNSPSRT